MNEQVVLVNEKDEVIGTMDKMQAHLEPILHRAFSVCLFNKHGEILLQKRASDKYHCPGLWTNTCCSHPRMNEDVIDAAKRRLQEEMGIVCDIHKSFHFIYEVQLGNGLYEHELDHVFMGEFSGEPQINPIEVEDCKYLSLQAIEHEMANSPGKFTPWFKIIIEKLKEKQIGF